MLHFWHLDSGLFDRVKGDSSFAVGLTGLRGEIRERLERAKLELGDRLE
jgi:hypothetical protein